MIYAICNQKGGQGKTTTAAALFDGLPGNNLAVDMDPQRNLTIYIDIEQATAKNLKGSYEVIAGELPAEKAIIQTPRGAIIKASPALAVADIEIKDSRRLFGLKRALASIKGKYDNIIIDCPPALNILLINALEAAQQIIIPMTPDAFSYVGLTQLQDTITEARKQNPELKAGILFTKFNPRTKLNNRLTEGIKQYAAIHGIKVYNTAIRESVAIREAQLFNETIYTYAPQSNAIKDYTEFIKELTNERGKHNEK